MLAELCFSAPYSNGSRKCFFSQKRIMKTDWRNALPETNLTNLLRNKLSRPLLKVFLEEDCLKAAKLWYND